MKIYLDLLQKILDDGIEAEGRNGKTKSLFGEQLKFDLTLGFPAITTKTLMWKSVVSELLWFIEGSNDERRLAEILYGTRDATNKTIWTANANSDYWKPKAKFDGDVGKIYGVNWREWQVASRHGILPDDVHIWHPGSTGMIDNKVWYNPNPIDQLTNLVNGIKNDPYSRRHVLMAYNPGELDDVALPPCHMFSQFYVRNNQLSCHMYQRSADFLLGIPFNIASYALLTHMIAQVCKLQVNELIISIGDSHLYSDHVDKAKLQLTRSPKQLPTLWLNPDVTDITKFLMDDCKLINYQHHPSISAPMAV